MSPPIPERARPLALTAADRILVTGFGVTGYALADQVMQMGATVTVVDGADTAENRERAQVLQTLGVEVRLGAEHTTDLPAERVDLVLTSPGWRPDQPLLAAAQRAGIPVWSEIELAWRVRDETSAPWLAVTGTNGKTTVVTMLESILTAAGLRAAAAGNVGAPLIEAVRHPEPFDVIAVELSSYQLHWTEHLDCEAAAVLNVSPDHLDWHGSVDAYVAAKGKIFEGTRRACLFNDGDPATRRLVEDADVAEGARAVGVGLSAPGLSMLGVIEDVLVDRAFLADRRSSALELGTFADLAHLAPRGVPAPHQVQNALFAAGLARAHGVDPAAVRAGLRSYRTEEHRIAPVAATGDDILWIDDSKATNAHAARASLSSVHDVVWIAGGLAKGARFDDLVAFAQPRLRAAVLIGVDDSPWRDALARHAPGLPVLRVEPSDDGGDRSAESRRVMDEAVRLARSAAGPGSTVLLAPACASMDQFESYAERGDLFARAVEGPSTEE